MKKIYLSIASIVFFFSVISSASAVGNGNFALQRYYTVLHPGDPIYFTYGSTIASGTQFTVDICLDPDCLNVYGRSIDMAYTAPTPPDVFSIDYDYGTYSSDSMFNFPAQKVCVDTTCDILPTAFVLEEDTKLLNTVALDNLVYGIGFLIFLTSALLVLKFHS